MAHIEFIDTSILLELLRIPGKSQQPEPVADQFKDRIERHMTLILPVTAVIETGNHIAQLADGAVRRQCAEKFARLLRDVLAENSPWLFNEVNWSREFWTRLVTGSVTGSDLVAHATTGLGMGDLAIIPERDDYQERSGVAGVGIWTLDQLLSAHST